jgi:SAM-dependent methyltransferase
VLDPALRKFDVIWVVAVSTHFRDIESFIKSVSALLKPGGRVVIFDWMVNPQRAASCQSRLKAVTSAMLMPSINSRDEYEGMFTRNGYSIVYSENSTLKTVKTWADASKGIVSSLGMLWRVNPRELADIVTFVRGIRAIKAAMKAGCVESGIVIGQKL